MKAFRDYLAEVDNLGTKRLDSPAMNDIAAAPKKAAPAPAPGNAATTAPVAPKAAPHQYVPGATWNQGVLGIGSTGPEVDKLRQRLGLAPNGGKFDNETRDAVIQRQKELGVQADGAWGPGTARADAAKPKTPAAPATPPQKDGGIMPAPAKPTAPTSTQVQTDDNGNHMITTPDGKSMVVGPDGKPLPNGGRAPATPSTQPPATAAQPALGTKKGATQAIPTAPVNPANPGGATSQMNMTPDQASAALGGSERDIAALGGRERLQQLAGIPKAAPAAPSGIKSLDPSQFQKGPAPATPAPQQLQKAGTTTTQTSVSGEMKMGRPSGPITFNGTVVNPGEPQYAAASQALIQQQQRATSFRTRGDRAVDRNLATSGAPVSTGAPNVDRSTFEESLDKMLTIAGLR